jgi:hypothetical protein
MKCRLLDFSGTAAVYPLSQAANVRARLNRGPRSRQLRSADPLRGSLVKHHGLKVIAKVEECSDFYAITAEAAGESTRPLWRSPSMHTRSFREIHLASAR